MSSERESVFFFSSFSLTSQHLHNHRSVIHSASKRESSRKTQNQTSLELKVRRCNLKSRYISREAINAQDHLPRSLPLSTPSTASNFTIVLSDSALRIHCESKISYKQSSNQFTADRLTNIS